MQGEGSEEDGEGHDETPDDGGESGALASTQRHHEGSGDPRHGQTARPHPACRGKREVVRYGGERGGTVLHGDMRNVGQACSPEGEEPDKRRGEGERVVRCGRERDKGRNVTV